MKIEHKTANDIKSDLVFGTEHYKSHPQRRKIMKNKLRSCLGILLSLCMVLSACCFTAFAEGETQPLSEQGVYYVQHGATGNGLSESTPGSFATVVAIINASYDADDTVTIKIVKGEYDDVASVKKADLGNVFHASMADIPAHAATLLITSADPASPSRLAWTNTYMAENNKGKNITLTGPTILKDIKMIDSRINYY